MTEGGRRSRVLRPDADVEQLLAMMEGAPPLSSMSPQDARTAMVAAAPLFYPDMPPIDEERIEIADVPVRIYRPEGCNRSELAPAMLYFHGGGWTMGDMDGFGPPCAMLANFAGVTVISVDYALAPEHPFPAALEQGLTIADELFENGSAYGVDSDRLGIGGDSAGGNLAAVIAIDRRNRGVANFRHQALIYPVTDARFETASYDECGDGYMMSRATMEWFLAHYIQQEGDPADWRISPLLAESLEDLPPAHIVTCGLDPLQDEGRAFADALERAGVDVSRRHHARQIHGFLFMGKSIGAVEPALKEIAAILRSALV